MAIVDTVWARLARFNPPVNPPDRNQQVRRRYPLLTAIRILRWLLLLAVLAALGWAGLYEARTSYLESRVFRYLDARMSFALAPGPSEAIRFPRNGPYDERLGYTRLPDFINSLTARQYGVD